MENISSNILFIIIGAVVLSYVILTIQILGKSAAIQKLRMSVTKLRDSFNILDEQAKLIVKTDLELNKAQDELDKRLESLDALQRTSRRISTTLDVDEIFKRLNKSLDDDLEFEHCLAFIYDQNHKLNSRVHIGYNAEENQKILSNLAGDTILEQAFSEGKTLSSINILRELKVSIQKTFDIEHFVITPILAQNSVIGTFFVGNRSTAQAITEGDEELVSILANQIGQALENARLFEEAYRSQQELEVKVQERTKQLATALNEVQMISKTKTEFISAVSHELRTPLTSIKGYAAILMAGKLGQIPDQVKERLQKINTHSDNLVGLINDLLDITRIESGRVEMNMTTCQLPNIIENIRDLLTPQMKDKDIQWVGDIDASIPDLILDVSQIERVFINLIGNAIKFTPEQGCITVRAKMSGTRVQVDISDTGIGISENDLPKLFEEFYRVENKINQNVKGTGLGLPLAKKIIIAHNGEMWASSKVGKGTTFHFYLPTEQENTDSQDQNQTPPTNA